MIKPIPKQGLDDVAQALEPRTRMLFKFLETVHTKAKESNLNFFSMTNKFVYNLYNGSALPKNNSNSEGYAQILVELVTLWDERCTANAKGRMAALNAVAELAKLDPISAGRRRKGASNNPATNDSWQIKPISSGNATGPFSTEHNQNREFLAPDFVHELSQDIKFRVFVNPVIGHVRSIMLHVLTEFVLMDNTGVIMAKLPVDASVFASYYDVLVVYCTSQQAAEKVALDLGKQFKAECFNEELPAMTLPKCRGVGIGAEPVVKKGAKDTSFGDARAEAIATAWSKLYRSSNNSSNFTVYAFFNEVIKTFRASNLDPHNPHLNLS
jgi:HopA1 effector protein family